MKLLTQSQANTSTEGVLAVDNAADVLALSLEGVQRIDLHFPKFADGRAFSQAVLLRRRLGFKGTIRATGDVLIDQLVQMQRCGFSEACCARTRTWPMVSPTAHREAETAKAHRG